MTYVTIEEHATLKKQKEKAEKNKGKQAAEKAASEKGDDEKPKKDRSQLECWHCKEKGHFSSNCPQKKKAKEDQGVANVMWLEQEEYCMFCTTSKVQEYEVNSAVNVTQKLTETKILLDLMHHLGSQSFFSPRRTVGNAYVYPRLNIPKGTS